MNLAKIDARHVLMNIFVVIYFHEFLFLAESMKINCPGNKIGLQCLRESVLINTVKPVLGDHHWEGPNVVSQGRWSLRPGNK